MITPPLSIWARPFLVAQVEVSTVIGLGSSLSFPVAGGLGWPRGRRPFELGIPLAIPARRLSHEGGFTLVLRLGAAAPPAIGRPRCGLMKLPTCVRPTCVRREHHRTKI